MTKISVVIITLNEGKKISRCIDSVKDVADEIIVVDSFSTDRTKEICLSKNVRFVEHKFEGHIEQKNYVVSLASNNIVLSLDADEELSPTLKESILKVKNDFQSDAYSFNRLNNYYGKWIHHSGMYPDRKVRLWNRTKGEWGGTNPHDKVIMQSDAETSFLKGNLLHYTCETISEHVNQQNWFSNIAAKAMREKGKKSGWAIILLAPLFKFVRCYFLNLGFLDGFHGLVVCTITAYSTFLKYVKLKRLNSELN